MSDLWNMWIEVIRELENTHMQCTKNDENNNEMDGVEVIDLCSVSQSNYDMFSEGKESTKQESQDNQNMTERIKWQSNPRQRRANLRPKKGKPEYAMM